MNNTHCNTPSLYIYKVYHNAANVNKSNVDFYKHTLTLPYMIECANNPHYRIFNKNLSTYQN